MKQAVRLVAGVGIFVVVAVFAVIRLALGVALSILAPLIMPLLALLSGGGLIVTIALACTGHWHPPLMAGWACFICTVGLGLFAGLVQLVNPYAFRYPVVITHADSREGQRK